MLARVSSHVTSFGLALLVTAAYLSVPMALLVCGGIAGVTYAVRRRETDVGLAMSTYALVLALALMGRAGRTQAATAVALALAIAAVAAALAVLVWAVRQFVLHRDRSA